MMGLSSGAFAQKIKTDSVYVRYTPYLYDSITLVIARPFEIVTDTMLSVRYTLIGKCNCIIGSGIWEGYSIRQQYNWINGTSNISPGIWILDTLKLTKAQQQP